jgi:hypothetical protein
MILNFGEKIFCPWYHGINRITIRIIVLYLLYLLYIVTVLIEKVFYYDYLQK